MDSAVKLGSLTSTSALEDSAVKLGQAQQVSNLNSTVRTRRPRPHHGFPCDSSSSLLPLEFGPESPSRAYQRQLQARGRSAENHPFLLQDAEDRYSAAMCGVSCC